MDHLQIVNPLPQALAYYSIQLVDTLNRIGIRSTPVAGRAVERGELDSTVRMLGGSVSNVAAFRGGPTLQIWPSLGLVEGRIWTSQDFVVFHDPVPIRRQHGYGKIAAAVARAPRWAGRGPTLVAHSSDAADATRKIFPSARVELAFLPVRSTAPGAIVKPTGLARVLVAGQYKPTRDVELLSELGHVLAAKGYEPVIIGRGWPDIPGWSVRSEFVTEGELESEIANAAVLLVPYTRYFQSAVALRALEIGTPVTLAKNSFARHLLDGFPGLFDSGAGAHVVADTIDEALGYQHPEAALAAYRYRVDASWESLLSLH